MRPTTIDTSRIRGTLIGQSSGTSHTHLNPNTPKNPPFDGRVTRDTYAGFGEARKPQLLRGRMGLWQPEKISIPGTGDRKYTRSVDFLYNPTTISHSFEFDQSAVPAASRQAEDLGRNLMTGQSLNWSLLFNRTYEMAYQRSPEDRSGVLEDTKALEYMIGTADGQGTQAVEVVVVFGATRGGKPWAFFGWIINASIDYLMFNHRMIPMVAKVDLTLARRWVPMEATTTVSTTTGQGEVPLGTINADGTITGNRVTTEGAPGVQTTVTRTVNPDGTITETHTSL